MFSTDKIPELLLSVLATFIALCIHEYAHAYAAYKLGDKTAEQNGRLSLNPLKHIDPVGALFMVFFRFGWAKPVPVDPRNFKKPKRDFAIVALAGPLSNIICAFFSTLLLLVFIKMLSLPGISAVGGTLLYNTCLFFSIFSSLSVGLGVFNLIPIPPFDGSRILNIILPAKIYFKVMKYERRIYWGVIAWLFLGDYVYAALSSIPLVSSTPALLAIAKIFDLSGLIGIAINSIYNALISFWQLIPFLS